MATTNKELKHQRQLLSAVKTFDERCRTVPIFAANRDPLVLSDEDVEFLEELRPTDKHGFFSAPHLAIADGLETKNADISEISVKTFYARDEVKRLWAAIDELPGMKILAINGQPGTGKSTAVWRKVLEMAIKGGNILWVSLDRDGTVVSAVYFQGRYLYRIRMKHAEVPVFLNAPGVPLDTVVLDGRSTKSTELVGEIEYWVKYSDPGSQVRAIYLSSSEVEEHRPHQNSYVLYFIVHSWKIEEFHDALVQEKCPTTLYDTCAELFYKEYYGIDAINTDEGDDSDASMDSTSADGDSDQAGTATAETPSKKPKTEIPVKDIFPLIVSRYAYSGGSAHWMFNYSKKKMDALLYKYCDSTSNRTTILNGETGPTSDASTNYFFGSSRKKDGTTEYFLVSKRAVEVLGEMTSGQVYGVLYRFATRLANPSFLGWIVEADFFSQVDKARKSPVELKANLKATNHTLQPHSFHPVAICYFDHTKNKNRLLTLDSFTAKLSTKARIVKRITGIVSKLVATTPGHSVVCKPTAWNQGCYDAVFVELKKDKIIHLRFAQITVGESHSLKGEYFYTVVRFFEKTGYTVESVEIALFLTHRNSTSFTLKDIEGVKFLENYLVYNSKEHWVADRIRDSVAEYELTLTDKVTYY